MEIEIERSDLEYIANRADEIASYLTSNWSNFKAMSIVLTAILEKVDELAKELDSEAETQET